LHEKAVDLILFFSRGALNTLLQLSDEQKKIGVIAASAGNHGLFIACSIE
jgi:threonine dehydratase